MLKSVPILGHFLVRPYLIGGIALGLVAGWLAPDNWPDSTRMLAGWVAGLLFYLLSMATVATRHKADEIRETADQQEEGRVAILLYTVAAVGTSLVAIVQELGVAKAAPPDEQGWHIALAGLTVLLSWLFMHTMFGVHYAHEYYSEGGDNKEGGIDFPGSGKPDYWDFIHFAAIIGCAAQTADIDITSKAIRRLVTMHAIISFFFNTTILALTVDIGSSLIE